MKFDYPETLIRLCKTLNSAGYEAWLVGGAVRDLYLNKKPKDWDVATNATPEQVKEAFVSQGISVYDTGVEFGTVSVLIPSIPGQLCLINDLYEVTTFRKDGRYTDGRRPDTVEYAKTIEEDLSRRDFTINAMAIDPITGAFVDDYNIHNEDLWNKTIRCVGNPVDRFNEDGLRCIRAIRFGAQLGFTIENDTMIAMNQCMDSFAKVSMERVSAELMKIFSVPSGSQVAIAVTRLMQSGIMDVLVPEMQPMIGCEQNCYHAFDVMDHTINVIAQCPTVVEPEVKLAALFHDIGKPSTQAPHKKRAGEYSFLGHEDVSAEMAFRIMTRLKFPNDVRDKVCHLIRHHLVMYQPSWSDAAVRRWIQRVGKDNYIELLHLFEADIRGKGNAKVKQDPAICYQLVHRVENLKEKTVTKPNQLAITGNDIIAIDAEFGARKPGKWVGEMVKFCMDLVTENPEYNTKEKLSEFVHQQLAVV